VIQKGTLIYILLGKNLLNIENIKLHTIFDNISCTPKSRCTSLWGFSLFIETPKKSILFDTGSNGRVLLQNIKEKNLNIKDINTIFISHGHWDHIGGLDSIVEENSNIDIFTTRHLSKNFIRDYNKLSNGVTVVDKQITKIADNIYSSGAIGDTKEQSIILDTNHGLIIIFGCAHSGVGEVSKIASKYFDKNILLLLGGFHLENKSDDEIFTLINTLNGCNTRYICPSHCTGDRAKEIFSSNLKDIYIEGEVGLSIEFDKDGILRFHL
jgi:7,8-dihydropterin-6-yl-methyl-4-(beta-D-ribofuranosyl)aminobenzene 5'-phosphate synthase